MCSCTSLFLFNGLNKPVSSRSLTGGHSFKLQSNDACHNPLPSSLTSQPKHYTQSSRPLFPTLISLSSFLFLFFKILCKCILTSCDILCTIFCTYKLDQYQMCINMKYICADSLSISYSLHDGFITTRAKSCSEVIKKVLKKYFKKLGLTFFHVPQSYLNSD